MKVKKITVLTLFLFISVCSFSQTDMISINPLQVNQTVTFGGDAKLTIKDYAEGNISTISQKLFGDMNLQIFRVPIFALQPISDPIYDNIIIVINAVKIVNPNVKIFASIANGDGYGNDFHGSDKFPSGWTGCCPNNVYSLNITTYSAYLDSFMNKMNNAGITIDYLGPYNEDPANDSDYLKITNQMTTLGTTKMVGLERWGLLTSITDVDDLEDRVDIVGSHFYDDENIPESNWDSKWAELVNKSENPVWYTEATRYKTNDNIDNLVAGMDNIFPALRGGAENITFYQVCKRFVFANGSTQNIKYTGFKNLVNNAEGNVTTTTSNNSNIKIVAFGKNNVLDVHIINKNTTDNTIDLQLQNGFLGNGTVSRTIWTPTNTEQQSSYTVNNASNWNIVVPASSYSHLKIPLDKSILGLNDNIIEDKQMLKVFPNPAKEGWFEIKMPQAINNKNASIKLFSMDGKEVFSETKNFESTILIKMKLASGVYFVNIEIGDIRYNSKIIISN